MFLLLPPFFLYVTQGKRALFFVCGSPSHSKKVSFFCAFFLSLFSLFLPLCLFYFLISPIKKIITRRRRKDLFSSSSFFLCVCVFFLSLTTEQHKKGIAKYLCAKAKKATLIFLGFAQKAPKKKRFSQNVTCSPLSRVSL